jgi:hypothetical protein
VEVGIKGLTGMIDQRSVRIVPVSVGAHRSIRGQAVVVTDARDRVA